MIGQTLGHYRIESKLGEGGMGVVYRAADTHLNRPVAIKVLRPESITAPERKQRFVQEAQAASALNHPNIITIYDITTSDGIDFIAMEYVAGKTLDQLIGRKGLTTAEALKCAVQIADALAKAHGAGIVHRDLKPANIMVTADGLVKVLDFGLAKLTEPEASDESAPTRSMTVDDRPRTEEGTIVGTVAYMSPEQAEGRKVDSRSDIFSFGVVLYEMLTGRRAFQGETKISTLSAILHKEPKPIGEIAEGTPRQLEWIISQCLRKDPARRSRHMEDVKVALEALKEESESGKLLAPEGRRAPRRPWLVPAIAGIVLLALAAGWWMSRNRAPSQGPVLTRLTFDSGLTTDPALSPDGKLVAYASDRSGEGNLDIWVQQVAGGEPIRLTRDPADDDEPTFSPDGSKVAFHSERDGGGIYAMSALGGEERLIARRGRRPRFSPNGKQIAYWIGVVGWSPAAPGAGKAYAVSADGGTPRQLQPEFDAARVPVWAPDGKHILFLGNRDARAPVVENYDWWVAPLDGGAAERTHAYDAFRKQFRVRPEGDPPSFVPGVWAANPDRVIFAATSGDTTNLWQIGLSARSWRVEETPQQLTFGTTRDAQPSIAVGLSGQARIAFASLAVNTKIWGLEMRADEAKVGADLRPLTDGAASDAYPSLSADGKKLVFGSSASGTAGGSSDVWVKDLESGKRTALAATAANEDWPSIAPDGSKAAYSILAADQSAIYVVDTRGGPPEKVCDDCGFPWHWSSDGKRILYYWVNKRRLGLVNVATGQKIELLKHPKYILAHPRFSPDDRWIVFVARTGANRARLVVAPFREGSTPAETDWIPITDDAGWGTSPCWSPGGSLVYFVDDRDGFHCIWTQRLDSATKHPLGPPAPLHHFHNASRSLSANISVARDKLAIELIDKTGNLWMAELPGRQ